MFVAMVVLGGGIVFLGLFLALWAWFHRRGRRQRRTSIFTDRLVSMVAERRYPPEASM